MDIAKPQMISWCCYPASDEPMWTWGGLLAIPLNAGLSPLSALRAAVILKEESSSMPFKFRAWDSGGSCW